MFEIDILEPFERIKRFLSRPKVPDYTLKKVPTPLTAKLLEEPIRSPTGSVMFQSDKLDFHLNTSSLRRTNYEPDLISQATRKRSHPLLSPLRENVNWNGTNTKTPLSPRIPKQRSLGGDVFRFKIIDNF